VIRWSILVVVIDVRSRGYIRALREAAPRRTEVGRSPIRGYQQRHPSRQHRAAGTIDARGQTYEGTFTTVNTGEIWLLDK